MYAYLYHGCFLFFSFITISIGCTILTWQIKPILPPRNIGEKDEVDESSYEIIRQEYEGLLPQAKEILLNTDSMETVKDTLDKYLNKEQQKRLFMEEPVSFRYKKEVGCGIVLPG
jgi:hypothetical protein